MLVSCVDPQTVKCLMGLYGHKQLPQKAFCTTAIYQDGWSSGERFICKQQMRCEQKICLFPDVLASKCIVWFGSGKNKLRNARKSKYFDLDSLGVCGSSPRSYNTGVEIQVICICSNLLLSKINNVFHSALNMNFCQEKHPFCKQFMALCLWACA